MIVREGKKKADAPQGSVPDTQAHVHIRCGSDIRESLRDAGFAGRFLEFSDPFCQGPVPDLPLPAFIERRVAFISESCQMPPAEVRARLDAAYAALASLQPEDRIVLWFEHDSYDQLILAFLLHHLAAAPQLSAEIICVGAVQGVERFIGLGQLAPGQLGALWETERRPVTPEMRACGHDVWRALVQDTPEGLQAICHAGTPALPLMAPALRRHLAELPAARNGLSLTQQCALEIVRDNPGVTVGQAFGLLMKEKDPLPFLGDLMFWAVVRGLGQGGAPLLSFPEPDSDSAWPRLPLSLTAAGQAVLEGRDYISLSPPPRWVGGVEIAGPGPCWRWDADKGKIARR